MENRGLPGESSGGSGQMQNLPAEFRRRERTGDLFRYAGIPGRHGLCKVKRPEVISKAEVLKLTP